MKFQSHLFYSSCQEQHFLRVFVREISQIFPSQKQTGIYPFVWQSYPFGSNSRQFDTVVTGTCGFVSGSNLICASWYKHQCKELGINSDWQLLPSVGFSSGEEETVINSRKWLGLVAYILKLFCMLLWLMKIAQFYPL